MNTSTMSTADNYIDIAYHSLNKVGEELCGDKVEVVKTGDRTIIVLADGLGSGVKANILATLTSKIMSTMLEKGSDLKETIETITLTLPICKVRQIGYATFSIIEIDSSLHCRLIEYDNPPIFFLRDHQIVPFESETILSSDKQVKVSSIQLQRDDQLVLCSDGVIHAGVGMLLNHGWEWHHVAEFLEDQEIESAEKLNRRLIETCSRLYDDKPGDDTTAITVSIRKPACTHVFSGPPENPKKDSAIIKAFMNQKGKKIICGGTAANIVARELKTAVVTDINYIDPLIPPTASVKGIDLVTEGVLTLKMLLGKLQTMNACCEEPLLKKDAVSCLIKMLVEESTHIKFWVGRAINPAHQNPDFPQELSIKLNVINDIADELKKMGKMVSLEYID